MRPKSSDPAANDPSERPPNRAHAVRRLADLRPTDSVLDVGCSEGVVSLEVAKLVGRIHGFDISEARVARASRSAAERGVPNATFETISIHDFPFEPLSWDVVLFMRVWGKTAGTRKAVGGEELARILTATRRQAVMLAGKRLGPGLEEIFDVCDRHGFDVLCFTKPNLILANRRGVDVRAGDLPEFAVAPTAWLLKHPVRFAPHTQGHD